MIRRSKPENVTNFTIQINAQKKYVIVSDSIRVGYKINENSDNFIEEILVTNLSSKTIYLPKIENKKLHFFILGSKFYSSFGIMFNILGTPNLGGRLELIKLLPKEDYNMEVTILKSKSKINKYFFGFDYIEVEKSQKKYIENDLLYIKISDYVDCKKYSVINCE